MSTTPTRGKFGNTSNKKALSVAQMAAHLAKLSGDRFCVVAGVLTHAGPSADPLTTPAQLFAAIDRYAEVDWRRNGVSREVFFEGLRQQAPAYEFATAAPHFPPVPTGRYLATAPKPANTGALDEWVDRFAPATGTDRDLIKAFTLTLFWGGPPGKRPLFVITSRAAGSPDRGRGDGKTTLAQKVGGLAGGVVRVRPAADGSRAVTRLLSPDAAAARLVLVDNLKSHKFGCDWIEELITADAVSGHRMYAGEGRRPNYLTWAITVNGPSFSTDVAKRGVPIEILPAPKAAAWEAETDAFARDRRADLLADVGWHLVKKKAKPAPVDRFPEWCAQVLSKVDRPKAAMAALGARRAALDEDAADADNTLFHLAACLRAAGVSDPDTAVVRIPSMLAGQWVRLIRPTDGTNQAIRFLRGLGSPRLVHKHTSVRNEFVWVGAAAAPDTPPTAVPYTVPRERV